MPKLSLNDSKKTKHTPAGKNGENRLYGQPIAESERRNILRPALEKLFAEIKRQSGEK